MSLDRTNTPMFTKEQIDWLENMAKEQVTLPSTDRELHYHLGKRFMIHQMYKANDYHRRKAQEGK